MRILLIAYEFPPSASPQSLRWSYLVRELALAGHEVHVLTIDLGGSTPGLPTLPDSVRVHRSYAGPMRGLVARRRKRRQQRMQQPAAVAGTPMPSRGLIRPGWKLRLSEQLQKLAGYLCFPDLRGEWRPWGRRALNVELQRLRPDVVISSHEPATTLELGLLARQAGFAWVADLADPVLAAYTLPRWRSRALALEHAVCTTADRVLVTADSAGRLLRQRHGPGVPIERLTQGFDDRFPDSDALPATTLFDPGRLELLYTGSFYSFRRPEALLAAVCGNPLVRLTIAAVVIPHSLRLACRLHPEQIRLLGFLPHTDTLQLQRQADVLISIANQDAAQVPGKLYEYLGAARPILHLVDGGADAPAQIILRYRRGHSCGNNVDAIARILAALAQAKQEQRLDASFDLGRAAVAEFGWSRLARRLEGVLADACAKTVRQDSAPAPPQCKARGRLSAWAAHWRT